MDASILVVGGSDFLSTLLQPIRSSPNCAVEIVANPSEAAPLIQAQQPDLLLIQGTQPGGLDLCRQVKAQNQLSWIYCIVLDDQPIDPKVDLQQNWQWDIQVEADALEAGADACVRLYPYPIHEPEKLSALQERLLYAQIQAGLRRVQNHRDLIRTNDILSAIALSDPLTELNNRRAFEWELPRQIHNARARGMPISLLMMDVDFFKHINDTYGHLVGDRALQLIAARLRHNLRFYDTPFRYGGEEFVIILSDTGLQEAAMIAARLCRLIGDQPFAINDSLDLTITISAGTASLQPDDDARGISLLRQADQNLLKAKSRGRNQVVSGEDPDPST